MQNNQDQPESPLRWPKSVDIPRLNNYSHFDDLYLGDHFKAFSIVGDKEFSKAYNKLRYVVANFAGLSSRVLADMLFGEKVLLTFEDESNQAFIDALIQDNHLFNQLYESALGNSRRGDSIFKIRIGPRDGNPKSPNEILIEEITPQIYFPTLDVSAARFTAKEQVLAWIVKQNGVTYLHKEIHTAGLIQHQVFNYNPVSQMIIAEVDPSVLGVPPQEETGVDRPLIFHIPNVRDGVSYFGTSDYQDLETLLFALNNRVTKVDNILDKHSDPILAVPPGVLNEDGTVNKAALNLLEVDNEQQGFNKPEYIVWNANLEAAFTEIDKLMNLLMLFSEISPASVGFSTSGDLNGMAAESGKALRYKLIATIRKRNRKALYYEIAIQEMLETALDLAKAKGIEIDGLAPGSKSEMCRIKWGEGIIADLGEEIDNEVKRVDAGLSSRADSIARIDDISVEDAQEKVEEIDKESQIKVPNLDKVTTEPNPTAPNPNAATPAGTPTSGNKSAPNIPPSKAGDVSPAKG